jgi:hypothetical protein
MEQIKCDTKFDSSLPLLIDVRVHERLKGLDYPYDESFGKILLQLTECLMINYSATKAYTHGFRILMLLLPKEGKTHGVQNDWQFFSSTVASFATLTFQRLNTEISKPDWFVTFKVRTKNLKNYFDAIKLFSKIQEEVVTKTVAIVCNLHYTSDDVFKKSITERKLMILKKGDAWENYPEHFRIGIFFEKK